jgi:hypothetical protein
VLDGQSRVEDKAKVNVTDGNAPATNKGVAPPDTKAETADAKATGSTP